MLFETVREAQKGSEEAKLERYCQDLCAKMFAKLG